jgi:cytochrome c-type biogenesis protein CcmH
MRRAALLGALAVALVAPGAAAAQDCPKTTLGEIEKEVMCPICGTPLALASEAPQAQRQRAFIEQQIADCRSEDQIKRALVAQFGEAVLALPGDEGDDDFEDVLVYLVPAVGIAAALGGIAFALVRWRRRQQSGRGAPATAGADAGRLDADMERYDL